MTLTVPLVGLKSKQNTVEVTESINKKNVSLVAT